MINVAQIKCNNLCFYFCETTSFFKKKNSRAAIKPIGFDNKIDDLKYYKSFGGINENMIIGMFIF